VLSASEVELQSKLQPSLILGRAADSEAGADTIVRYVEIRVIQRVQEVGPELDLHPFRDGKILLQTNVSFGVSGANDRTLSWTIPKSARRGG
jgi:hypothetical protein